MTVLLPFPPRRARLRSFWLVMSLLAGLLSGVSSSTHSLIVGMSVSALIALPGILRPRIAMFPYRVWNRLAREFARYAGLWLMGICYFIVFTALGRTGSFLRLAPPATAESLWIPRPNSASGPAGLDESTKAEKTSHRKSRIAAFFSSAMHSGNFWRLSLMPFFILVSSLDTEQRSGSVSEDLYTLF